MKSLVIILYIAFSSSVLLYAQDDECFEFFPTKKGAVLVSKSYDGSDSLICTTTYTVTKSDEFRSGSSIEVAYSLIDKVGNILDNGMLKARCEDGVFYMNLSNKAFRPDVIKMLGTDTEIIGDFLDYPDTFGSHDPFYGSVQRNESTFTVQSKKDKKKFITVKITDRKYVKNEPLMTPAGNFYASKVTFNMESRRDKNTVNKYQCVEWYAPNAGVIRSETYKDGVLFRYNVLTSISGHE